MKIIVFVFLVLSIIFIISSFIYYIIRKNSNKIISRLNNEKEITYLDFERAEFDLLIEDSSLELLQSQLNKYLHKLEKKLTNKFDSELDSDIEMLMYFLKETSSDIEAIAKSSTCINNGYYNLSENLKNLIKSIKKSKRNCKIFLNLPDEFDKNFLYDNYKLMSALRLILLKSFEKGIEEVNIIVKYDPLESNKIIFKIQNINFVDKTSLYSLSDIYAFLSLEFLEPEVLLYNLEPEFLIIRKNLLSITDRVIDFKKNNGNWEMTFALIV